MKITVVTLFPKIFSEVLSTSILDRAKDKKFVEYEVLDLRNFGEGERKTVDGRPFGGGPGMILRADILASAVKAVKKPGSHVILMSASGKPFNQAKAWELSELKNIIIICGHYEGVDQRFIDKYIDEEISIGDYILTGGEIPAMAVIDATVRLIPGVLKKPEATTEESFSTFHLTSSTFQLLEYPQYTRPETFEGKSVPEILRSGNHAEITKWRKEKAIEKTKKTRPDLLGGITQKG